MIKFGRSGSIDRLRRLAEHIAELARKDEERIKRELEVAEQRLHGARELHQVCSDFVSALNSLLPRAIVELSPAEFTAGTFHDAGENLYQINITGRLIQIEFRATDTVFSTEKYRVPYILEGEIRCFDQDALDRAVIPVDSLFYCVERGAQSWVVFDPRTHHATDFDRDLLITSMERFV